MPNDVPHAPGGWRHSWPRLWRAVRRNVAPVGVEAGNARVLAIAARARIAISVAAIAAVGFLPGTTTTERITLAAVIAGVFLPLSVIIARLGRRTVGWRAGLFVAGADLFVVFVFAIVVPEARTVALFAYLLIASYATLLAGATPGFILGALTVPLVTIAEIAGPDASHDAFTLVLYYVLMGALVGGIAGATAERRRVALLLARLQTAISGVTPEPDLARTLASIARGAREAVDGKFVSVLVRDRSGVMQGALEGDHAPDPKERSAAIIERIMAEPERSPSGTVLLTGAPVVVRDVASDPRFSHWADEGARQGFTSTIAVPLHGEAGSMGVLATYLSSPSLVTEDAVQLLSAYAEHAALMVQRAIAWEHERAMAERLAAADELRTDLVSTVSHELRTPLTSIHGFVETILRHWDRLDDAERRRMLDRVLSNSLELGRLIDQVLDYSHLEAGVVTVTPEPMPLESAVTAWADEHAHLVTSHQLVTEIEPVEVMAEPDALDRVLINLVTNAVKYSPPDTTIWIRGFQDGDRARLSVVDEGPGVAPEDRERIFDRFERGAHARSGVRGSGIGLAIVRRYVDLLGGEVWVEDRPGPGAEFTFTLPIAGPDDLERHRSGVSASPPVAR